ncbi:hypothetical protein [Priestia abyssalis]|uniref:hypothetical protein n=1 Tax=Priestia abyssalis TaxID=1221450 RepID=UPI0009957AA2|nr:hypothetical protein [Priestia abyssalis]
MRRMLKRVFYIVLTLMVAALVLILVTKGKDLLFVKAWVTMLGLTFLMIGLLYSRKNHEEQGMGGCTSSTGEWWMFLFSFLLDLLPWYARKMFWIILGVVVTGVGILV